MSGVDASNDVLPPGTSFRDAGFDKRETSLGEASKTCHTGNEAKGERGL